MTIWNFSSFLSQQQMIKSTINTVNSNNHLLKSICN